MTDLTFFWLVVLPLVASPLIYVIGRMDSQFDPKTHRPNIAFWVACIIMVLTWFPFVDSVLSYRVHGVQIFSLGTVNLKLDGMSLLLAGIVLALSTLVTVFSGFYIAGEEDQEKYYALLSALTGSMIGLACADDLFNLWIWFETMAISSYFLVAFYKKQPSSLEAGIKYLVQSAVGSVFVLLGIAIVFAHTGTMNLESIHLLLTRNATGQTPILAAGVLFIIGFGVKIALVPMHTWLPDAHSQAPSGISAMLSSVVIEAGLIALLRSIATISPTSALWGWLLMGFGAVNMLFGNLMALRQTRIKRLLAYSSLAHVGYMLAGLGFGFSFHLINGLTGGFFHLLTHGIMKGLAFLSVGALMSGLLLSKGSHHSLRVYHLDGAASRYPLVAFTLSIAVLALGGLPPLAGFMSKWQIFTAGFESHNPWAIGLVIFAAFNSVLSLGYYAPLINRMYRRQPSEIVQEGTSIPFLIQLPLIILCVLVVLIGFFPTLLNWLTLPAGQTLFAIING